MMAEVSDSQFRQLKKFMSESHFTCTDEWLLACIHWIKENNRSVNFEIWKRELSEQWKDANLEEMESFCLPKNLLNQKLVKLSGKYGLQVNSIRDIGESSYSQWTKLKKLENENVSVAATDSTEYKPTWEPTPKRCMYLTMTDGSQQVFGLEMQPILGLKINMKPGFKVIILGPVDCRRGVVHLKPNNIRIIGGEVEELLVSNRMEKILADTLKLAPTQLSVAQISQNSNNISRSTVKQEDIMGDFPDSEDPFPDVENDDDIFMEIDEEALLRSTSNKNDKCLPNSVGASARSTSQMTTQKISDNCATMTTTFTEEIEDFDDDPGFTGETCNTKLKQEGSTLYNSISTSSKSTASSSNVPINNSAPIRKTKPLFVPPIIQSKPVQIAFTSNNSSVSSTSSAAKSVGSSKSKPVTKTVMAAPTEFKSAKSVFNSKNSNSNPKQKDILQYLKPMPLIIDPPTPERQAIKRRKKIEEQNHPGDHAKSSNLQPEVPVAIKEELSENNRMTDVEMEVLAYKSGEDEDHDYLSQHSSPDESLLRIVDETLEFKLSESDIEPNSSIDISNKIVPAKTYPVKVSESPYVYLAQIKLDIEELIKKRKIVHVKACISTVVSNIQVNNGSWTLCVCINDGTDFLNCKISADILTDIIGFTPAEMKKIKAAKTKEAKQQIAQGMNNLARELVHLNAVFTVEIGEQPIITSIIDLKRNHSAALKSRLFKLGL